MTAPIGKGARDVQVRVARGTVSIHTDGRFDVSHKDRSERPKKMVDWGVGWEGGLIKRRR